MNLLKKVVYILNQLPNKKGLGPNGESIYDLAREIYDHEPKVYLRLFNHAEPEDNPQVIFELHGFYQTYCWLLKLDIGPGQEDMIAFEADDKEYFWYDGKRYSDFFVSASLDDNETVTELETTKMNK